MCAADCKLDGRANVREEDCIRAGGRRLVSVLKARAERRHVRVRPGREAPRLQADLSAEIVRARDRDSKVAVVGLTGTVKVCVGEGADLVVRVEIATVPIQFRPDLWRTGDSRESKYRRSPNERQSLRATRLAKQSVDVGGVGAEAHHGKRHLRSRIALLISPAAEAPTAASSPYRINQVSYASRCRCQQQLDDKDIQQPHLPSAHKIKDGDSAELLRGADTQTLMRGGADSGGPQLCQAAPHACL